jgi:hypothetical protein
MSYTVYRICIFKLNTIKSQGETFGDEDACFLHAGGLIHEGADFMPRKHTVISQKELQTLTLDGEDYLSIFHPGFIISKS